MHFYGVSPSVQSQLDVLFNCHTMKHTKDKSCLQLKLWMSFYRSPLKHSNLK